MSTSAVARGPANGGGGRAGGIPEWQQALRRHAESLRTVNQIIVKNAADAPLQQRRQMLLTLEGITAAVSEILTEHDFEDPANRSMVDTAWFSTLMNEFQKGAQLVKVLREDQASAMAAARSSGRPPIPPRGRQQQPQQQQAAEEKQDGRDEELEEKGDETAVAQADGGDDENGEEEEMDEEKYQQLLQEQQELEAMRAELTRKKEELRELMSMAALLQQQEADLLSEQEALARGEGGDDNDGDDDDDEGEEGDEEEYDEEGGDNNDETEEGDGDEEELSAEEMGRRALSQPEGEDQTEEEAQLRQELHSLLSQLHTLRDESQRLEQLRTQLEQEGAQALAAAAQQEEEVAQQEQLTSRKIAEGKPPRQPGQQARKAEPEQEEEEEEEEEYEDDFESYVSQEDRGQGRPSASASAQRQAAPRTQPPAAEEEKSEEIDEDQLDEEDAESLRKLTQAQALVGQLRNWLNLANETGQLPPLPNPALERVLGRALELSGSTNEPLAPVLTRLLFEDLGLPTPGSEEWMRLKIRSEAAALRQQKRAAAASATATAPSAAAVPPPQPPTGKETGSAARAEAPGQLEVDSLGSDDDDDSRPKTSRRVPHPTPDQFADYIPLSPPPKQRPTYEVQRAVFEGQGGGGGAQSEEDEEGRGTEEEEGEADVDESMVPPHNLSSTGRLSVARSLPGDRSGLNYSHSTPDRQSAIFESMTQSSSSAVDDVTALLTAVPSAADLVVGITEELREAGNGNFIEDARFRVAILRAVQQARREYERKNTLFNDVN